jgi:hypothetical protein
MTDSSNPPVRLRMGRRSEAKPKKHNLLTYSSHSAIIINITTWFVAYLNLPQAEGRSNDLTAFARRHVKVQTLKGQS